MNERHTPNVSTVDAILKVAEEISLLRKALKPEKKQLTEEEEEAAVEWIKAKTFTD